MNEEGRIIVVGGPLGHGGATQLLLPFHPQAPGVTSKIGRGRKKRVTMELYSPKK